MGCLYEWGVCKGVICKRGSLLLAAATEANGTHPTGIYSYFMIFNRVFSD